jgi:deoxyribonuclease V
VQSWPRTESEAFAVQEALRERVISGPGPASPGAVAGLDVAYQGDRLAAAVVVLDPADGTVLDTAVVRGTPAFPYVPGLFAFREIPTCSLTLRLAPRYRLPETTRAADRACRAAIR